MQGAHIDHKFVRGLSQMARPIYLSRKSGSWRTYHADSALVERNGRAYIAVALSNDSHGGKWMEDIIQELDRIVVSRRPRTLPASGIE